MKLSTSHVRSTRLHSSPHLPVPSLGRQILQNQQSAHPCVTLAAIHSHHIYESGQAASALPARRTVLMLMAALGCASPAAATESAVQSTSGLEVVEDTPGTGSHPADRGDLVLIHYVGSLPDGTVFDSTRGGLAYRDGGLGVFRPAAIRLGGSPVPGITAGLQAALVGMRVGGRRVVKLPASLGFGSTAVLAPYSYVPADTTLTYDIQLLRLSTRGPDELTKGIARCGSGGASQADSNCAAITIAEFLQL